MPSRSLEIDGATWRVQPSGFVTQYDADEYGIVFVRTGGARAARLTRYRPQASRGRDRSLAEMPDARLRELFARSQSLETAPEGGYSR